MPLFRTGRPGVRRNRTLRTICKQRYLLCMLLLPVVWMVIFNYIPMSGILIAFQNYKLSKGWFNSPWAGLANFVTLFKDPGISRAVKNTLGISILKVTLLFPLPILLALLLNEVRSRPFRRVVQTVSYLPYFISWVIVATMVNTWLSPSMGFVNFFLVKLGILKEPYFFLGDPDLFWWNSLALDAWKNIGWGSVIYMAAISSVDQEMYEAAVIDGANRFQRAVHLTIPAISGTIMVLLILNIGAMMGGGLYASNFDISFLVGNALTREKSDILDVYIYRMGISQGRYSYAAACGLLLSCIGAGLTYAANAVSGKITGESFF